MGVVIYRRVINVYDIPLDILVQCIGRGLDVDRTGDYPKLEVALGAGLHYDNEAFVTVGTGLGLKIDDNNCVACDLGSGLFHSNDGKVNVRTGSGLKMDDIGCLSIQTGSTTHIDPTTGLEAKVGMGLTVDPQAGIAVNVGEGLSVAPAAQATGTSGSINVNVGVGLSINPTTNAVDFNVGKGLAVATDNSVGVDSTPDPTQETVQTVLVDSKLSINAQQLLLTKTYADYKIERNTAGLVVSVTKADEYTQQDDVILAVPYGYGYGGYGYGYAGVGTPFRASTFEFPNFYQK